jgi:protein ImuB
VVFRDPEAERRAASAVPLDRLAIDPALRDLLGKLGIHTIGGYLTLPPGGLLLRFGHAAERLHALASGAAWDPLKPAPEVPPIETTLLLDDPESDVTRLLFGLKRGIGPLLARLAARAEALAALVVELTLDRGFGIQREALRPAEPTLDERTLLRLLHLRLESQPPRAAVREIRIHAVGVPARREQLALFRENARRDLRAGNEVLAQLRAELGEGAVRKAVLRDGHLPEAQYGWQAMDEIVLPAPAPGRERALVRRIHPRPRVLPPPHGRATHDDGWLLSGLEQGSVVRLHGPYRLSGGWWIKESTREYVFAEMKRGDCLWLYYDRARRRWFVQGIVE